MMGIWLSLDIINFFEIVFDKDDLNGLLTEEVYEFLKYHYVISSDKQWIEVVEENINETKWSIKEAEKLAEGTDIKSYIFNRYKDPVGVFNIRDEGDYNG